MYQTMDGLTTRVGMGPRLKQFIMPNFTTTTPADKSVGTITMTGDFRKCTNQFEFTSATTRPRSSPSFLDLLGVRKTETRSCVRSRSLTDMVPKLSNGASSSFPSSAVSLHLIFSQGLRKPRSSGIKYATLMAWTMEPTRRL
jgi:hypothetical protein